MPRNRQMKRGLSLREEKVMRLQDEQNSLRAFHPTTENLRKQQRALKRSLLGIRNMEKETKKQKMKRIKENQRINKSLSLQRKRRKEIDEKLAKEFNVGSRGFFFPFADTRISRVSKGRSARKTKGRKSPKIKRRR